jgi:signal transduction histidine kinase
VATTSVGWRLVALGVAFVSWAAAGGAVVLLAVNREAPAELAYWLMDVLSAVVYGAVVVVMLPRVRHPVAWIMVLVALGCGLSGFASEYAVLAHDRDLPAGDAVAVVGSWVWTPGTYASMAVMPWLVRPARWARPVVVAGVVAVALATLRVATYPYQGIDNPLAVRVEPWKVFLQHLHLHADRCVTVLGLAGALWLGWLWLRARDDRGRGLGWLCVGVLFLTAAFAPIVFVRFDGGDAELVYEVSGVSLIIAQAFLPVALLVVVLRQRLWGVDLAVSRVTVWALLTGAVVVGYAGLAWLGGRLLPGSEEVAGLVAVGVVVALGQPLRWFLQGRVDRLVYGDGTDPVRLLGALEPAPDHARTRLDALVAALRSDLRLGGVEVRSLDQQVRAGSGALDRVEADLPLLVDGRPLGRLLVSPVDGQRLDARTRHQLDQLRGVLGVALELEVVNRRLEAASSRLVEVRMEERRMLRRDLHDGMGPALAGVGLGLAAAQRRLLHDPEGAAALLAELEAEVERRTDDVRLLARSLLPFQLDDGELGPALEVMARRFAGSGLDVRVRCRGADGLDTREQLAIYHVAAEAVFNAYRHARADSVSVEVAGTASGPTVLLVTDDGVGISGTPRRGVGLSSMRERAEELGGTVHIGPAPAGAGTVVRMELP